jgi:hypothetical protein
MSAVKYSWPVAKLHALLSRPGGKTRAEAMTGASACLEDCREEAAAGVAESLEAIDATLAQAERGELSHGQLYVILQHAERLASTAAIFEWPTMERVMASMGELGMALLESGPRPAYPIAVHARAARWAAENAAMSADEARPVVDGLLKVVARFDTRDPTRPA